MDVHNQFNQFHGVSYKKKNIPSTIPTIVVLLNIVHELHGHTEEGLIGI